MKEEDDYDDDDDDNEQNNPATVLRLQKYTTWLYIFLFMVSLYILCYIAIVKPESQTITKYNITRAVFNQLNREHSDTLSCSCSKVEVPFKAFVSNKTVFHPVCKSIFVDQQWIETLYLKDASRYGTGDFRTTAYSQVSEYLLLQISFYS
ncbi:unnamed protein product [Adineta steineri]|uniref:Uncharacterized protein n=1 Tax=Adineta steineri TaxID=433720 RepID=A0A819FEY7_9BILA|nr:unnamed protein product [Adineta steineri]CAF4124014.1 unnamed protein product [Adineta steineri]